MANLYIHAGNHKSGSTTIQRFLHDHKENIAKHGIYVYSRDQQKRQRRGNLSWWFDHSVLSKDGVRIKKGFSESIAKFSQGNDVILSSECFSWIFRKEELLDLKESLSCFFDRIVIFFYVRRQDVHAVSHYQQATKTIAEQDFYSGPPLALPKVTDNIYLYLDYHKRISNWGDVFGDENIYVNPMKEAILKSGSLTKHLFSVIGVSEIPNESKPSNESYGWERTKINHLLVKSGIDPRSELSKYINGFLDNKGKLLPSRSEAIQFYNNFRYSNKKLNERFNVSNNGFIFDDDFTFYPEEGNDKWCEDTANKALENVILVIKDLYNMRQK